MKSIESTGKNLNQAIESGLKELGVGADDVQVTVLNAGGIFSKCKVLLTVIDKEQDAPAKEIKAKEPAENKAVKVEKPTETEIVKENSQMEVSENLEEFKREHASDDAIIQTVAEFISGLGEAAIMPMKALVQISEETIEVSVKGDGAKNFVGHNGDTLHAVQHLVNILVQSKLREQRRVFMDIDNYKSRREEELISLAKRMARQVVKNGRPIKLRYMNAYERRIVHTALQNDLLVETYSTGIEPRRFLTIRPKRQ